MREKMVASQTLPDFQQYLLSRKLVLGKSVTFYAYWANRYLTFSKRLKSADAAEALRMFLEDLQSQENIADWQVQQAKEAIQLYTTHFHGGKAVGTADYEIKATSGPFVPDRVLASIQEAIRVKHYSLSTERTYLTWARRFFDYTGKRGGPSPYGAGPPAGQGYRFWIRADFRSGIQGGQRPFDNPAGSRPGTPSTAPDGSQGLTQSGSGKGIWGSLSA